MERVSLGLPWAEDEIGAELFECFGFFDEADAAILEGDDQLAGKAFRDNMQFLKSIAQLLFPDGVFGFNVGYDLPSDLSVLVCHGFSVKILFCGQRSKP